MENVTETSETKCRASKEKLISRKRAKPNGNGDPSKSINHGDHSENVLDEMIEWTLIYHESYAIKRKRHQKAELSKSEERE